jgi:peptidoglycan/LPS O-acetylase OafA/YrhL
MPTHRDLTNLDILRSFAVLLVATGHFTMYEQIARYNGWIGLTGVCLFFVHTCLVLMWSLERDPHTGRFYIRRAFRLFPLWLVVLAVVVIVHLPTSPVPPVNGVLFLYHSPSFGELLANITLTANIWYGSNIVGASWSLPIEMQMYLFLPLLFFFIRSTHALWVLLVLDVVVIASVWAVVGIHNTPHATLAICVPYFLPGVMAYALYKRVQPRLPAWTFLMFLLVMAAIHMRGGNLFRSAFWCLGIGLALPFFRQITWRPLAHAAHLVARYSYGIYLCHIPSIWVGMTVLRGHSIFLQLALALATLIAASVGLYHLVEAPMIRLGGKIATKIEPGPGPRMNEATLSLEPAP